MRSLDTPFVAVLFTAVFSMVDSTELDGADWDTKPLREMLKIAGGPCTDCAAPYRATEALQSIAMGMKSVPRCFPCLQRRMNRDAHELKQFIANFILRQQCFARAWEVAEKLDRDEARETSGNTVSDRWNAGELGCGELVLALAGRLKALAPGGLFSLRAADPGAAEDIPAWCRLCGHTLVFASPPEFLIRRKGD